MDVFTSYGRNWSARIKIPIFWWFYPDCVALQQSDVHRRPILTYKDGPRTEIIEIFIMVVDPYHRYSNEAERAN